MPRKEDSPISRSLILNNDNKLVLSPLRKSNSLLDLSNICERERLRINNAAPRIANPPTLGTDVSRRTLILSPGGLGRTMSAANLSKSNSAAQMSLLRRALTSPQHRSMQLIKSPIRLIKSPKGGHHQNVQVVQVPNIGISKSKTVIALVPPKKPSKG